MSISKSPSYASSAMNWLSSLFSPNRTINPHHLYIPCEGVWNDLSTFQELLTGSSTSVNRSKQMYYIFTPTNKEICSTLKNEEIYQKSYQFFQKLENTSGNYFSPIPRKEPREIYATVHDLHDSNFYQNFDFNNDLTRSYLAVQYTIGPNAKALISMPVMDFQDFSPNYPDLGLDHSAEQFSAMVSLGVRNRRFEDTTNHIFTIDFSQYDDFQVPAIPFMIWIVDLNNQTSIDLFKHSMNGFSEMLTRQGFFPLSQIPMYIFTISNNFDNILLSQPQLEDHCNELNLHNQREYHSISLESREDMLNLHHLFNFILLKFCLSTLYPQTHQNLFHSPSYYKKSYNYITSLLTPSYAANTSPIRPLLSKNQSQPISPIDLINLFINKNIDSGTNLRVLNYITPQTSMKQFKALLYHSAYQQLPFVPQLRHMELIPSRFYTHKSSLPPDFFNNYITVCSNIDMEPPNSYYPSLWQMIEIMANAHGISSSRFRYTVTVEVIFGEDGEDGEDKEVHQDDHGDGRKSANSEPKTVFDQDGQFVIEHGDTKLSAREFTTTSSNMNKSSKIFSKSLAPTFLSLLLSTDSKNVETLQPNQKNGSFLKSLSTMFSFSSQNELPKVTGQRTTLPISVYTRHLPQYDTSYDKYLNSMNIYQDNVKGGVERGDSDEKLSSDNSENIENNNQLSNNPPKPKKHSIKLRYTIKSYSTNELTESLVLNVEKRARDYHQSDPKTKDTFSQGFSELIKNHDLLQEWEHNRKLDKLNQNSDTKIEQEDFEHNLIDKISSLAIPAIITNRITYPSSTSFFVNSNEFTTDEQIQQNNNHFTTSSTECHSRPLLISPNVNLSFVTPPDIDVTQFNISKRSGQTQTKVLTSVSQFHLIGPPNQNNAITTTTMLPPPQPVGFVPPPPGGLGLNLPPLRPVLPPAGFPPLPGPSLPSTLKLLPPKKTIVKPQSMPVPIATKSDSDKDYDNKHKFYIVPQLQYGDDRYWISIAMKRSSRFLPFFDSRILFFHQFRSTRIKRSTPSPQGSVSIVQLGFPLPSGNDIQAPFLEHDGGVFLDNSAIVSKFKAHFQLHLEELLYTNCPVHVILLNHRLSNSVEVDKPIQPVTTVDKDCQSQQDNVLNTEGAEDDDVVTSATITTASGIALTNTPTSTNDDDVEPGVPHPPLIFNDEQTTLTRIHHRTHSRIKPYNLNKLQKAPPKDPLPPDEEYNINIYNQAVVEMIDYLATLMPTDQINKIFSFHYVHIDQLGALYHEIERFNMLKRVHEVYSNIFKHYYNVDLD